MDHSGHEHHVHPLESPREYAKFALVIAGIVLASLLVTKLRGGGWQQFMPDFMGIFFLVFGFFKLVNLELFALTYRGYDLLARAIPGWAYAFPFIEIGLGLAYLLVGGTVPLNLFTIFLTGTASVGVLRELTKKSKIMCACLGTVIRLPLSKISFVEDFAMFVMAALMLAL